MKSDRYFYSTVAALMLLIMFLGFQAFYLHGEGVGGRKIDPGIYPWVAVHGTAITAWYGLFLVQSLLITVRNRRLHMKLGWSAVAITLVVAVSGAIVPLRSVQNSPDFRFFSMAYPDFLLVMLAETTLFTLCVVAGLVTRKRPEIHRSMMLLAGLSILAGATSRIPVLHRLFGDNGWVGLFGPAFTLGAMLLLVNSIRLRTFDRWLAMGYAVMVITYIAAEHLSVTDTWRHLAGGLLK